MRQFSSDVAFTPAIKSIQAEKGSRSNYSRMEASGSWETSVTPELETFLSDLDMFYLGTSNAGGQPYIQYRGGSPGFLKVVNEKTLGFADFGGNRQYISLGNASETPRRSSSSSITRKAAASNSGALCALSRMTRRFSISFVTRPTRGKSSGPSCSRSKRGTRTARSTSTSDSHRDRLPQ